jgi:hydroxymethylglutaryl-CoA reductase (NADPH)
VTLVFPDSSTINSAPSTYAVPSNVSAELLPSSSNSFSTLSHDTSLAFAVPYNEASDFLISMQEIAAPEDAAEMHILDTEGTREEKKWLMRASKHGNAPGGVRNWLQESWTSFVDLLKVCRSWQKYLQHTADRLFRTRILVILSSWRWDILLCT